MKKLAKRYAASLALVEKSKKYSLQEACELVKKTATAKCDESIDVSFHLNINPKQADQQLRGTIVLPHGNGKTVKVLAITDKVSEATAAGADFVGQQDMLDKIQKENWFDFDVIVATPNMMGLLGRMGRVLGPKGLMPNPKSGTVTPDIGNAIKEIKNGKITYRNDKDGNVAVNFGKASFTAEKLLDNLKAVIETINKVKPASVKGTYILSATISSTFGPAIKVNL
ncbi:MAG: 50S ribosomal protein L1 [Candidatus Enterosoma sp.]|nr:50S ribosomal protein L1 [Bacilli bacterium]MDD6846270.1 50S ribosomal protein L1 [bacterium]MDY2572380.1 50S ribosomal protein L1 [Candidatus Enterosoma sp.]MCI6608199.1 50S ribosomal protein L1 [Bacilli bacterium]MCI7065531.1 50S ribosomal protein L1 [Bacilli bacterium]